MSVYLIPVILMSTTVRTIEHHPTAEGDVPTELCTIVTCGQLDLSDPTLSAEGAAIDGDPYEDFPEDQDQLNDGSVQEKPEVALRVAREIREVGNKLFKDGKAEQALGKYQSGSQSFSVTPRCSNILRIIARMCNIIESIRYLDSHPTLPEDSPPELKDSYDALLAPLLLNSALAALRAGGPTNAQIALQSAGRALRSLALNDSDKGSVMIHLFSL